MDNKAFFELNAFTEKMPVNRSELKKFAFFKRNSFAKSSPELEKTHASKQTKRSAWQPVKLIEQVGEHVGEQVGKQVGEQVSCSELKTLVSKRIDFYNARKGIEGIEREEKNNKKKDAADATPDFPIPDFPETTGSNSPCLIRTTIGKPLFYALRDSIEPPLRQPLSFGLSPPHFAGCS